MADFPIEFTNAVDDVLPGDGTPISAKHINNLEEKVGIDASEDTSSLDYLITNADSVEPGHKHSKLWASDGSPEAVTVDETGNVGIGAASFGTDSNKVLAMGSGIAPTTFPADIAQMCVKDQAAGNACFHFYTELGQIIKLYQQVHLADLNAAYGAGDLDTEAEIITALNLTNAKINALLAYLENMGFIATA